MTVSETYFAEKVMEQTVTIDDLERQLRGYQQENKELRARVRSLTMTVSSMAAGPIHEVSPEQFSMLVSEGTVQ